MNNDRNMDVVDWRDPIAGGVRESRQHWPPTLAGVMGTLMLHALIVPSALLGTRGPTPRPPIIQESGTIAMSKSDSDASLVLITLAVTSNSKRDLAQDASWQFRPTKMAVTSRLEIDPPALLDIEILPLSEDRPFPSIGGSGDAAEQARLVGIYTGQIRARVERIWKRPRTPVNEVVNGEAPKVADDSFQCQVQIVQDTSGGVQEVLLPRCNGSPEWQRSLVMAIQQASPLPAPPSARVFSHSIALDFVGMPYVAGGSAEGYTVTSAPIDLATAGPTFHVLLAKPQPPD